MNLAQNDQNMDISLADISVMAQADSESGDDGEYRYVWVVTTTKCTCLDGTDECYKVKCELAIAPDWASGCSSGASDKCM